MAPSGRYPTREEIEVIIARARQMRALYVGALIARGISRVAQLFSGARRLRHDMG